VTGAGHLDLDDVASRVEQIKNHVKVPVGVGFGIRDGDTARAVAKLSDAVVIGSRLVEEIEKSDVKTIVPNVENFIKSIRSAIDQK
jgi:tryptophan synthase alpha chain